jgi:hypothetical protein
MVGVPNPILSHSNVGGGRFAAEFVGVPENWEVQLGDVDPVDGVAELRCGFRIAVGQGMA